MKIIIFFILSFSALTARAALVKTTKIDRVEIVAGNCQIREITEIKENGKLISKSYHRSSYQPEADVSNLTAYARGICQAAWTPDVIKKFKDNLKAQEAKFQQSQ